MASKLVQAIRELTNKAALARKNIELKAQEFEEEDKVERYPLDIVECFTLNLWADVEFANGVEYGVSHLKNLLSDEEQQELRGALFKPKTHRFYYSPTEAAKRPKHFNMVVVDGKEIVYTEGPNYPDQICKADDAILVYESDDIPHIRVIDLCSKEEKK